MDTEGIAGLVGVALRVGAALAEAVVAAVRAGDVKTLEALAAVCPRPEVLEAQDLALKEQQRAKALAELGAGGGA